MAQYYRDRAAGLRSFEANAQKQTDELKEKAIEEAPFIATTAVGGKFLEKIPAVKSFVKEKVVGKFKKWFGKADSPEIESLVSSSVDDVLKRRNRYYSKLVTSQSRSRLPGEVNRELSSFGYRTPYANDAVVVEAMLAEQTKFVRVFAKGKTTPAGRWVMNVDDVKGLTPKQIQDKYALPYMPTHITDVSLPKGTRIRAGKVGPNFGRRGGNVQYELLDRVEDAFSNARSLK